MTLKQMEYTLAVAKTEYISEAAKVIRIAAELIRIHS